MVCQYDESTVMSGFRYRLEPMPHQESVLFRLSGCCRWVWNYFLNLREDAYLCAKSAGGSIPNGIFSYINNAARLTHLRRSTPWLRRGYINSQQQTLRDLDAAYYNFFIGRTGLPCHKKRQTDSFRVSGQGIILIDRDFVRIPKLGWVRFRKSRDIPAGRLISATISRNGGNWFISLTIQHTSSCAQAVGSPIGIDVGISASVTSSNGSSYQFPTETLSEREKSARLYRNVARKKRGSNRRKRAIARLAKHSRRISNRVKDYQHKLSTRLATEHSEIHIESLRIKRMTQSARGTPENPGRNVKQKANLNRAMRVQAHGQFIRMLEYKCERSGSKLIFKNPAYTSQECAVCGHISEANRPSQAEFCCVACGHADNADVNAAKVILKRPAGGLSVAARGGKGRKTPIEARTQSRTSEDSPSSTEISAQMHSASCQEDVKRENNAHAPSGLFL